MTLIKRVNIVVIAGMLVGALSACEKQGPMERAGEKMDKAMEDTGDKLKDIADDVEDAVTVDGR